VSGPRLRFAPSPTGSLHLGNARTALFNWLAARSKGGTFILRIEDTDTEREQDGSESAILEDLRWLGLTWDEGPGVEGPHAPYRQSERADGYARAVGELLASGAAFRCFCVTPGEDAAREAAHHAAGSAAGHRDPCRAIGAEESGARAGRGEAFAVRFRVPLHDAAGSPSIRFRDRLHGDVAVPLAQVPDAVLTRSDRRPTYNFAVVVDDAAMKIDLVLRGDDHLSNTPIQVLLYRALGASVPEFAHVPMVLGPDGERLSKRHGATSVAAWRERGVPPEALINALALMGWAPSGDRTIVSIDDILGEFDLDRVGRSAAIFDPVKLEWISSQHIHAIAPERLRSEVARRLVASGRLDAGALAEAGDWVAAVAEFLRPALNRFDQVAAGIEPIFHPGGALDDEGRAVLGAPESRAVLSALTGWLASATPSEASDWSALKRSVGAVSGAKGKALFQPIRVALTGREHGRELDRLIPLLVEGHRLRPADVPSIASRVERTMDTLR
jgi:nondiscriminating glutamyl-tRNA synthetase